MEPQPKQKGHTNKTLFPGKFYRHYLDENFVRFQIVLPYTI